MLQLVLTLFRRIVSGRDYVLASKIVERHCSQMIHGAEISANSYLGFRITVHES